MAKSNAPRGRVSRQARAQLNKAAEQAPEGDVLEPRDYINLLVLLKQGTWQLNADQATAVAVLKHKLTTKVQALQAELEADGEDAPSTD